MFELSVRRCGFVPHRPSVERYDPSCRSIPPTWPRHVPSEPLTERTRNIRKGGSPFVPVVLGSPGSFEGHTSVVAHRHHAAAGSQCSKPCRLAPVPNVTLQLRSWWAAPAGFCCRRPIIGRTAITGPRDWSGWEAGVRPAPGLAPRPTQGGRINGSERSLLRKGGAADWPALQPWRFMTATWRTIVRSDQSPRALSIGWESGLVRLTPSRQADASSAGKSPRPGS